MKKNIFSSKYVLLSLLSFLILFLSFFPNQTKAQIQTTGSNACALSFFRSNITDNTINPMGFAVLSWSQSNCTGLILSSSDGRFSNTSVANNTQISTGQLANTTTYVLTGAGAGGNVSQLTLTIRVVPKGTDTSACEIYSFTANGTNYAQVYYGSSASLSWNTSTGCTNVGISGDNNTNFGNKENVGGFVIRPFHNTVIYTLTASDVDGITRTAKVTVFVYGGGGNNGSCAITGFYSSSTYVNSGEKVSLNWTTAGCKNVSISGTNDSVPFSYSLPANGSIQTNPLYGTSNFVITANGDVSATYTPITVYVSGGPYPYSNGQSNSNSMAVTGVATNVGSTSVKLNGMFLASNYVTNAWFEYGTNSNLDRETSTQYFYSGPTRNYAETIYTNPSTTYYYRAVAKMNNVLYRGEIMSVVTKAAEDKTVYVQQTTTPTRTTTPVDQTTPTGMVTQTQTPTPTTNSGVTVLITNAGDKVYVGDTVDFTINYANGTKDKLSNVKLNIILPQGFELIQTTQGQAISPTIINVDIGTLDPGKTGSIFLQAKVGNTVSLTNTLITNGTLSYTNPNKTTDSTVGYVLNHAGGVSSLGGFSFGAGFFPTTVLGWLVTILIILAVILTIRRITKSSGGGLHH